MVPSMPNGNGGEQIMGLPLREAREVFEREYLIAQINRFGGNISRTAEFIGMERSALHRKLKSLGDRLRLRRLASMSRIAYVNGRYRPLRDAAVHIEDRGYQFADGVYEVCAVRAGRSSTSAAISSGWSARSRELRIRLPMRARRLASCCARWCGATGCATASSTCRSPAAWRAATTPSRRPARRRASWSPPAQLDSAGTRRIAAEGVAVITVPENRWGRVDIKTVALLPNVLAKQAAREQGAREAWFVDSRASSPRAPRPTPGSSRATARWSRARPTTPSCAASPAPCCSTCRGAGPRRSRSGLHGRRGQGAREAFITSASQLVMPVVRIDGRPVGNGAPGLVASALRRDFHRHAEFA